MKSDKTKKRGLVSLVAVGRHKNNFPDEHYELMLTASGFVGQNNINADVVRIKDFNELIQEIDSHPGTIVLFSNFPPNEYYEDMKEYNKFKSDERYGTTINIYKSIFKKRPDVHLNVITGATPLGLSDNKVIDISNKSSINLIRFDQWYHGDGFYQNYKTFIYNTLSEKFGI